MDSVSWHSFDLKTGRRGVSLVTQQRGSLKRIIGEATDAGLDVSCWDESKQKPRSGWDDGTVPGRTMLVALDDDTEEIIWGGMVLRRVSNEGPSVGVSLVTLEHYLERRYVRDLGYLDVDQATIAAGIMDSIAVDGLDFTIDAPTTGTLRTRTYADDEDKTVLSALTELKDIEDGLEFTVDLAWVDGSHMQLERILRVKPRIGASPSRPTVWTLPGAVKSFELIEDYSAEFGANDVMATASGEGETRPESEHVVARNYIDAGWAMFEQRYSPSTTVTTFEQLNAHARAHLTEVTLGLSSLSIVADLASAPRLNDDWAMGDDIEIALVCPRFPEQVGPDGELVPGFTRRQRVVGWEIDYDAGTLAPLTREVS